MDVLELNMLIKTTETLLNYGEIDANSHLMIGTITSSSPFTFTVFGDNEQLIPIQHSVVFGGNKLSVNSQFITGIVSKFQLKLEGSDFDINVKLWKPYPVSPVLP
jgi:S1-C subfamily serine protease